MAFGVAHEAPMAQRLGVDRRDPFHNEALLAFMLSAPFDLSWRQGSTKTLMRRAMREALPRGLVAKGRTGRLEPFFRAGRQGYRRQLALHIGRQQESLLRFVDPARLFSLTKEKPDCPESLLSVAAGYALWRRHCIGALEQP